MQLLSFIFNGATSHTIYSKHTAGATMLLLLLLLASTATITSSSAGHCTSLTATTNTYRKCLRLPTQDASLSWTYHPHNATVELAFTGIFISPSGWVGFGINPDSPSMSGATALISFPDPTSGNLLLLPFFLDKSVKLQRSPLHSRSPPGDLTLLSSSASLLSPSVRVSASVRILVTLHLSHNRTRVHLVWNRGLYVQGYSPTIHPTAATDLASRTTVDLLADVASARWFPAAHGAINAAAWGICIPVGAMAARYLRQWPEVGPTWFYLHAAVQMVGVVAGTVGFGMGVAMGGGGAHAMHRGLGIAAVTAGGLQAAAVLFRPGRTNRYRKYWKSYHHLVGYGLVVVGVVNVFQGMGVMGLEAGSYAKLAYCLVLATMAGVCVALEANAWVVFCRSAEEEKIKREEKVAGGGVPGSAPKESRTFF